MKLKHLLVGAMLAVSALAMLADAAARPMGGGRSFGRQSGSVSRMAPTPAPAPRPAASPSPAAPGVAPGMAAPRPASPWRGIVGGALLGLGLGALMSQAGFERDPDAWRRPVRAGLGHAAAGAADTDVQQPAAAAAAHTVGRAG